MTAWTRTQTARFKAAAIGADIANHISMHATQDIPSLYEASPIKFGHCAKTPTPILHGEQDNRVPGALERQGVKVKMQHLDWADQYLK